MKKYKVKVIETLEKTITVEAESAKQARDKVSDMYYDEKFELDYNDLVSTDFEVEQD